MLENEQATSGKASAGTGVAEGSPAPETIQVWVVDDNDCVRAEVVKMLGRQQGISCQRHFDSPDSVLSALASQTGPDVLLLDIHMGEFNGLDAVRPIRSLSQATRVLMFTTFFSHEARARALAEGASGFMLKHERSEEIVATIRRVWKQPAPPMRRRKRPSPARTGRTSRSRISGTIVEPRASKEVAGSLGIRHPVVRRFFNRWFSLFQSGGN